jgi:long-chain fatty acid transport protein
MGKFDKYSGLFAEQGGFDIPSAYNFGVAIQPTSQLTLTSDIQRTHYSEVASVGNPLLPNLTGARLGDDNGPGFGWRDLTVGRFGVQIDASRNWTWRGGISVGGQTVPESEVLFNIVAPAVLRSHAAFGLTRRMGSRAFHLAVVRAFSASVAGANPLEVPGRQNIGLRMDQWEVEIGFTFGARR